ncbi:MAG TPA: helix-turn-helix domain-containing protein [Solirubrobacteraceae bacterium]|jgi:excisionase family DNA binding protein|nr:helix-turn-helix domain-containing protein [Solirubrobacteraceae bacterium]
MNETTGSAEPESRDDRWLTLAEIAEELRVNPATVRLWVRKGQLEATRAGMRKLIVRRSELERMLASANPTAGKVPDPAVSESPFTANPGPEVLPNDEGLAPRFVPPVGTRESVNALVDVASESVARAFRASELAPPSAGYPDRLRAIADGFEHLAATVLHAARTSDVRWEGRHDWGPETLPYEVRPGGNRPSGDGLWDRFDAAFTALGDAMAGSEIVVVGQAFREASDQLLAVADRLAQNDAQRADRTVG